MNKNIFQVTLIPEIPRECIIFYEIRVGTTSMYAEVFIYNIDVYQCNIDVSLVFLKLCKGYLTVELVRL